VLGAPAVCFAWGCLSPSADARRDSTVIRLRQPEAIDDPLVPMGQTRKAHNPARRAPSRAKRSAVTSSDQLSHSSWFISINSFATLMTRLSKPTRRRFLLNTGILAAGWELSRADAVLTQELAPTPFCRDGDEPTVRQTEGPFFKPRSPSAVTCASLALEGVGSNFLALC
jgi:hypothetical protein